MRKLNKKDYNSQVFSLRKFLFFAPAHELPEASELFKIYNIEVPIKNQPRSNNSNFEYKTRLE